MFVYFMHTDNYVKIGITNNVSSRVKQVQTGCPIMIFVVKFLEVKNRDEALSIEKYLHKSFKCLNTYGEWFQTINQPFYALLENELLNFNYSISDLKVHFDFSKNRKNDVSISMKKAIEDLRNKNNTYSKKIYRLTKYINRINTNTNDLYIVYSKDFILHMCNQEITRYMELIKHSEMEINTIINEKLKTSYTENEAEITEQRKRLINELNKIDENIKNKNFSILENKKPTYENNIIKRKKKTDISSIYKKYGL